MELERIEECILPVYYKNFFPFHQICTLFWNPKREFIFETANGIWNRYITYPTPESFKRDVIQRVPAKIHIGAIYDRIMKKGEEAEIMSKELVFDVDITSYDKTRTCCKDKSMLCPKCWLFCEVGMKIVAHVLKEMYGFIRILYVFSGGKGFHIWVFDENACKMKAEARMEISRFFKNWKIGIEKCHPIMREIYDSICKDYIKPLVYDSQNAGKIYEAMRRDRGDMEAAFYFMFPRLDEKVTENLNHPVKLPFCKHAKTGKASIPLDLDNIRCPLIMETPIQQSIKQLDDFIQSQMMDS